MDERIKHFIDSLRSELNGLPQEEISEAVGYYEEYFNDAVAAGKDPDEVIRKLDAPEKIARTIRTESYIVKAQRNPGLRNFTGVLRNATKIATTPLSVFLISIVVILSFCMVALLFAASFVLIVEAIVIMVGLIYEALKIPTQFSMNIIGTIGFSLFAAGLSLLGALGLFRLGKLFIRISAQLIRKISMHSGKPAPEMEKQPEGRKIRSRRILTAYITMTILGLLLSGISELPVKYFTIFNSMKPENIVLKTFEYQPEKVGSISVTTANSIIRITEGTSDKITLTYEQPDWLEYELADSANKLVFTERSNGRMPLFTLASMHEGMTEVAISLPKGYNPETITLETNGGHIYISGIAANIRAKTYSNSISLKAPNLLKDLNVKAFTRTGDIIVEGVKAGTKTNDGTEYNKNVNASKTADLSSSNGSIHID